MSPRQHPPPICPIGRPVNAGRVRRPGGPTLALLAVLIVAGASLAFALHRQRGEQAGFPHVKPVQRAGGKSNPQWAGYVVRGHTFGGVAATWSVPSIHCTSQDTNASFWVGLDGAATDTVQQTGVEALCRDGQARYYAFYEFYPAASVRPHWEVRPGDVVHAQVRRLSPGTFSVALSVGSHPRLNVRHTISQAAAASAEVITEQSGDSYAPLSAFSRVTFTGVTVDDQPIGTARYYRLTMVDRDGRPRAVTTPLDASGARFAVTRQHRQ